MLQELYLILGIKITIILISMDLKLKYTDIMQWESTRCAKVLK